MPKKPDICACGLPLPARAGWRDTHLKSKWHAAGAEAIALRSRGVSYAEIGRQLNLTRAYVRNRLSRCGKARASCNSKREIAA
jgi:hypothetical protein